MKKLILLFGLIILASPAFAKSPDYVTTDSVGIAYQCWNCSGSKKATCDSVRWFVFKDTTNARAWAVDSGKVTSTTAPSFCLALNSVAGVYELRVPAGKRGIGIYHCIGSAWLDTCMSDINYTWAAADTTTDNLIRKCLKPTVAGRTLDIASTGEAGMDFANTNVYTGDGPPQLAIDITGSVSYVLNPVFANVVQIDSQFTSAWNLNRAFDGDTTWGTNAPMSISNIYIQPETGGLNDPAIQINSVGKGIQLNSEYDAWEINANQGIGLNINSGSVGISVASSSNYDILLAGSGHMVGWIDSVGYMTNVSAQVNAIQGYIGAGNQWKQYLLPFGVANKESLVTLNGTGDKVSTIYIWPSPTPGIYDSVTQSIWIEP